MSFINDQMEPDEDRELGPLPPLDFDDLSQDYVDGYMEESAPAHLSRIAGLLGGYYHTLVLKGVPPAVAGDMLRQIHAVYLQREVL